MTIRFVELFAGIGGFRYGLESIDGEENSGGKAYSEGTPEDGQGLVTTQGKRTSTKKRWASKYPDYQLNSRAFTCVYSNEINEHANAIYRRNYGQEEARQDTRSISEVGAGEIPDHDLLTAGFPCQSFSVAGQRGGLDDTRGTLFFDVARILSEKRPQHFILENVKGLLSHDGGRTFNTIIGVLSDLGYRCEWEVVNSKYFGVPQSRDRVYIVGHLRGKCSGRVLPLIRTTSINHQSDESGRIVKAIHNKYGGFKEKMVRVFDILPTLRTPKGGGHIPDIFEWDTVKKILGIRRITEIEGERAQGFEDNWTSHGDYGDGETIHMSGTQRYRGIGNAVTPLIPRAIGLKLIEECKI